MGMSQEDKIVNFIIENRKEDVVGHEEWGIECHPEVNYNDYGTRGVVDLVVVKHEREVSNIRVIEVKSDYAVKNATGANEIIRQFNRHIDSFFAGSDFNKRDYWDVTYELCFYATDRTLQHIFDHSGMYESTEMEGGLGESTAHVTLRHPDVHSVANPLHELEFNGDEDYSGRYWHQEWDFASVLTDARVLE